ncbi:MAG: CoA-binding protein, partial [Kiloniellaceae bacterium]
MSATPGRFDRLLRPRTIAVFGGRAARRVMEQCDKLGFQGEIWPVHPRHREVAGRRCFIRAETLPGAPDAAFIGVNRHGTVEIVRALAARGAGGAVCYAAGFREAETELAGAAQLEDALVAAAGPMPILGPNCYGLVNALDGAPLWPDQHGLARADRGVAILAQSSNIAINLSMQTRGLPIAYLATLGNQAQTGLSELAGGLLADPRVTALGMYIEGFDDVAALERLAGAARALGKPMVALKVGQSQSARRATVSHTASLAGDDDAASALFRRLGIGRVHTLPAFLEALKLLHV